MGRDTAVAFSADTPCFLGDACARCLHFILHTVSPPGRWCSCPPWQLGSLSCRQTAGEEPSLDPHGSRLHAQPLFEGTALSLAYVRGSERALSRHQGVKGASHALFYSEGDESLGDGLEGNELCWRRPAERPLQPACCMHPALGRLPTNCKSPPPTRTRAGSTISPVCLAAVLRVVMSPCLLPPILSSLPAAPGCPHFGIFPAPKGPLGPAPHPGSVALPPGRPLWEACDVGVSEPQEDRVGEAGPVSEGGGGAHPKTYCLAATLRPAQGPEFSFCLVFP